jgi:hypothetical protein
MHANGDGGGARVSLSACGPRCLAHIACQGVARTRIARGLRLTDACPGERPARRRWWRSSLAELRHYFHCSPVVTWTKGGAANGTQTARRCLTMTRRRRGSSPLGVWRFGGLRQLLGQSAESPSTMCLDRLRQRTWVMEPPARRRCPLSLPSAVRRNQHIRRAPDPLYHAITFAMNVKVVSLWDTRNAIFITTQTRDTRREPTNLLIALRNNCPHTLSHLSGWFCLLVLIALSQGKALEGTDALIWIYR